MVKRWTLNRKTRILQFAHLAGVLLSFWFLTWEWLATVLGAYIFFETFGGNIGLHRYFGHRSFKTSKAGDLFLCCAANLVGAGSTLSWVGTHRYHHRHSDSPADVHSPYFQSYRKIIFGDWDVNVPFSFVKDLVRNPIHRFFHKYYFKIHIAWAVLLFAIQPKLVLFIYCWPCFLCLQSGYLLAIWAHKHGYRTYETGDQARNSWLVSLYTLGEGWHNNHHRFPERLRQGEKWWEFDFPALVAETVFVRK